jgi:hypothetical protein
VQVTDAPCPYCGEALRWQAPINVQVTSATGGPAAHVHDCPNARCGCHALWVSVPLVNHGEPAAYRLPAYTVDTQRQMAPGQWEQVGFQDLKPGDIVRIYEGRTYGSGVNMVKVARRPYFIVPGGGWGVEGDALKENV